MKDFDRVHPQAALCGLNCLLCPLNVGGYCPGCGGGTGNQGCPRARCARDIGITDFCFQCGQYPCALYDHSSDYDSFVPTGQMEEDMRRIQELGAEAYVRALEEKRVILDTLLAEWNDGRRKSLYCTAAYRLELDVLRTVTSQVQAAVPGDMPVRERAARMAAALQAAADTRGITLKLNKKVKGKGRKQT